MILSYQHTDRKELLQIHESSLRILQETGIKIFSEEVLKQLSEHGVQVDFQSNVAKFPSSTVDNSLKTCPKEFSLYGREYQNRIDLSVDGPIYTRSTGGPEYILDPETGERRQLTLKSVGDYVCLIDALPHIRYLNSVWPLDVPFNARDIHTMAAMFRNTGKHVTLAPSSPKSVDYIVELLKVIHGDGDGYSQKPLATLFVSASSPLKYGKESAEILLKAGKYHIPVMINSSPLAGGTSPVTIAGTVVLINAEILAGIAIHQLLNPGAPLIYVPRPQIFDMRTGICGHGYVENSLASVLLTHLSKDLYHLPIEILGPASDAKILNQQSILERAFLTFTSCFARPNLIAGAGNLESSSLISPIQLIIDNEIHGIMYRALRGIEISETTLGVEQIQQVKYDRDFLQLEHTLLNFKKEFFLSDFFDRKVRGIWESSTKRDITDAALERYRNIMTTHTPPILGEQKEQEIDKIIKSAEKDL